MKDKYIQLRESPLAEMLLSLIIGLTLMTWLLIIRGPKEFIQISIPAQYITLSLVIVHVVIRRRLLDLFQCILITVAVSVVFFFALMLIPTTGYGSSGINIFYLAAIVFAFTVFSIQYRFKPALKAGDSNLMLFPALTLPPFGFYYYLTRHGVLVRLFIFNVVLIAVLYLFVRQFAVFESKYYHSISKSSVPVRHLKKQNYMTGVYMSVIFLIIFIILSFLPFVGYTNYLNSLVRSILPVIITAFLAFMNILGSLLLGDDTIIGEEGDNYLREQASDSPWVYVLAYFMAIAFLLVVIHIIPKAIRLIIQSAPKYHKVTASTDDGIIVDTIEDINPDQKVRSEIGHDFGEGYERKIRKKFYTKTRHAMNKGLPVSSSSTPGQIEKVLLADGDTDISELRPEYEHVRYSK